MMRWVRLVMVPGSLFVTRYQMRVRDGILEPDEYAYWSSIFFVSQSMPNLPAKTLLCYIGVRLHDNQWREPSILLTFYGASGPFRMWLDDLGSLEAIACPEHM